MSPRAKLLALTLAMLGFLGVATTAQAANQMYSGSLIIEAFGGFGIPHGAHCNTRVDPANVCGPTTLSDGAPLTGYGSLNDTTPPAGKARGFTFPASGLAAKLGTAPTKFSTPTPYAPKQPLNGVPGGSSPYFYRTPYHFTYADLKNQAGSFKHGGGPGSFSFVYTAPYRTATVKVTAGPNQFGGVMRLLGTLQGRGAFRVPYYETFVYSPNWLFDLVGESGQGSAFGTVKHVTSFLTYAFTIKATAFPWTTGTASVYIGRRYFQYRQGYDNRTAQGRGTIQLVSPLLTHWLRAPAASDGDTPAIGVLRIEIGLPEPERWMMLVAGLGLLGVLYRARLR